MIKNDKKEDLGGRCTAAASGFCLEWGYCRNCWDAECNKQRKETRTPKQNSKCFRCKNAKPVFLGITCDQGGS